MIRQEMTHLIGICSVVGIEQPIKNSRLLLHDSDHHYQDLNRREHIYETIAEV